jgi:bacillolysin
MDSAADSDYYRVSVPAGGKIAVSLTQLPADYDLYLADPGRNIVAVSRYGGTANEYVFYTAPAAGAHYVYVVGFNHAYVPLTPYRLMVQVN